MSTNENSKNGISRRNALKAGVAVGVGAVAWAGPTITSMGGTPAYAFTCTNFTLRSFAEDRNTTQACAIKGSLLEPWQTEYQVVNLPGLTSSYSMTPTDTGGPWGRSPSTAKKGCNVTDDKSTNGVPKQWDATFTFPVTETCEVTVRVHDNGKFFDSAFWSFDKTWTAAGGTVAVYLPSDQQVYDYKVANATARAFNSNTRFSVLIECVPSEVTNC
jgi:hypothetical protein